MEEIEDSEFPWAVIQVAATHSETGEDKVFTNVIPRFGREHDLNPHCWCEPRWEENDLLVHTQEH